MRRYSEEGEGVACVCECSFMAFESVCVSMGGILGGPRWTGEWCVTSALQIKACGRSHSDCKVAPEFLNELHLCRFWSVSAEWENMLFSLSCVKHTEEGVDADMTKKTLHHWCTFLMNKPHVVPSYHFLKLHQFCLSELQKVWNRKNICYLDR